MTENRAGKVIAIEKPALSLPRREFLRRASLTAGAAGLVTAVSPGLAQTISALAPTPDQMEGPFFPENLPVDMDNDLVRVTGRAAEAFGRVAHIGGRVMDITGRPVEDAMVEIWQCDNTGKYNHSWDRQPQPFDGNFQGYGRTFTAGDGSYRFRTIKPVPYPGRTPHIHFKVAAEGYESLTSQMYIAGDPLNTQDWIFMNETPEDRQRLLMSLNEADQIEQGALAGNFDIVLVPK